MPLFEFACRDCGHRFEYLTRQGHQPACPACHGEALEKQLSVFAVSTGSNTDSRIDSGVLWIVRRSARSGLLFDTLTAVFFLEFRAFHV